MDVGADGCGRRRLVHTAEGEPKQIMTTTKNIVPTFYLEQGAANHTLTGEQHHVL